MVFQRIEVKMEDASSVYLELFEREIIMSRLQIIKNKAICNILLAANSLNSFEFKKEEEDYYKQLKKNLWHYYSKMSEEDKLYVAVTYGIPEKVEEED